MFQRVGEQQNKKKKIFPEYVSLYFLFFLHVFTACTFPCPPAVIMAEGNQPQRKNLAEIALRRNYVALHDALAQPRVAADLAIKLYGGVIITPETRDEILTPGIPCTQQAYSLLRAVESSIKMDHTRFQKFVRMVKKQPVLKPIATQLRQCYSKFKNFI